MAELTYAKRKRLSKKTFAIPEKRKYQIGRAHV